MTTEARKTSLHKAARLTFLAAVLHRVMSGASANRGRHIPYRERQLDTAVLAQVCGVTRRSIQRDLHQARMVSAMATQYQDRLAEVVRRRGKAAANATASISPQKPPSPPVPGQRESRRNGYASPWLSRPKS
jgi:hypothetical protein